MSRTNPDQQIEWLNDPAKKVIEWKPKEVSFRGYDLEAKENFEISMPFLFLVLDELQEIGGYSKTYSSKIVSNLQKKREKGYFRVGIIDKAGGNDYPVSGFWSDIKDMKMPSGKIFYKDDGAKWHKVVYAVVKIDKKYEIVKIALKGLAAQAYSDSIKNPYKGIIKVEKHTQVRTNGQVVNVPVFEIKDSHADAEKIAAEFDAILQVYLKNNFDNQNKIIKFPEQQQKPISTTSEAEPVPAVAKPVKEADEFIAKVRKQKQEMEFGEDFTEPTNDLPF